MADAGLTNGAFYAHFTSKDDLVANVVADQLHTQAETFSTLPPGQAGLEEFLRDYLSPQHRDNPSDGCPSAALLDEIGRCATATKDAYTAGARSIVDEIATLVAAKHPDKWALFALLDGHDIRPELLKRAQPGPFLTPTGRAYTEDNA